MARAAVSSGALGEQSAGATVRVNLFVSGLYAWLATVGAPTIGRGDLGAHLSAAGALILLVGGLLVAPRFPRVGRAVTMGGFVGLSVLTWVLLGDLLEVNQLEPVRAASGALGWVLFAFGWGAVRNVHSVPENDPRVIAGQPLAPRRALPPTTYVVFGLALLGALAPWLLAWRVTRPEHALFAHATALLCAIAMVSVGAQVSVQRGRRWLPPRPSDRFNAASTALAAMVLVAVLGVAAWWVRG
jgi:hypothetical protein